MPLEADPKQRNLLTIVPLQSVFPTPHMPVWASCKIRVCSLPILHWVTSFLSSGEHNVLQQDASKDMLAVWWPGSREPLCLEGAFSYTLAMADDPPMDHSDLVVE